MSKRNKRILQLNIDDYINDVRHCSVETSGVYIWLLCRMHDSEQYGSIVLLDKYKHESGGTQQFAAMLSKEMPYDTKTIRRALDELIENNVIAFNGDDVIYQDRMRKDGELSSIRSISGSKGGRPSKPKENQSETKTEPNESQDSDNQLFVNEELVMEDCKKVDDKELVDKRFDIFWQAYPRKNGKGKAKESFKRISPNKELFERIMNAVEAAKQSKQWQKENGQFIPFPATWLNQKRWDDDYSDGLQRNTRMKEVDPSVNPFDGWDK